MASHHPSTSDTPQTPADLSDGITFLEPSTPPGEDSLSSVLEKPPVKPPPVRVFEAESVDEVEDTDVDSVADEKVQFVDERSLPVRLWHYFCGFAEWMFGMASLLVSLAVLATVPILQILSLGYLLEASGRIARTGRFSAGLIGVKQMARIGGLVAGTWLMLLPVYYVRDLWYASNLIEQTSVTTAGFRILQMVVTGVMVTHILTAWFCGGRFRHFFWPVIAPIQLFIWVTRFFFSTPSLRPAIDNTIGLISPRLVQDICNWKPLTDWFVPAILVKSIFAGTIYTRARDEVWDFVIGLRLPHYFWLGARGFAGTIAWLFIPIMLMIGGTGFPNGVGQVFCGIFGVLSLSVVVLYLPFLQIHFAAENRFVAMFEIGQVRKAFRRAPIAFWLALVATLTFAVPLYLLKIEFLASELTWIPAFVFVVFMFPAHLATGWALSRGRRREKPRFFLFRWASRLAGLPIAFLYSLIVLGTPLLSWYGKWSLFEQHAFLVPVPFLNL